MCNYIFDYAVLEIVVGHWTFSDQNWCLSKHVPVWSDIMSYHNMLTSVENSLNKIYIKLDSVSRYKSTLMSEHFCTRL